MFCWKLLIFLKKCCGMWHLGLSRLPCPSLKLKLVPDGKNTGTQGAAHCVKLTLRSVLPTHFLRLGLLELGFQLSAAENHSDSQPLVKYYKKKRNPGLSLMLKSLDKAKHKETRTVWTLLFWELTQSYFRSWQPRFICTFPKSFLYQPVSMANQRKCCTLF